MVMKPGALEPDGVKALPEIQLWGVNIISISILAKCGSRSLSLLSPETFQKSLLDDLESIKIISKGNLQE